MTVVYRYPIDIEQDKFLGGASSKVNYRLLVTLSRLHEIRLSSLSFHQAWRNPKHRDVIWMPSLALDSGNPCRNDSLRRIRQTDFLLDA